ncbi:MAG: AAA family ATPase [Nostoc indistinguendum CM1-VF10]|nr:AAA family ATPase [Nostoc indistinguendum CM1-VF10]
MISSERQLTNPQSPTQTTQTYSQIIQIWKQIPHTFNEANLEANLVQPILNALDLNLAQVKAKPHFGNGVGLAPDRLVYKDLAQPPILVIENKRRDPSLANAPELGFVDLCKQNGLYREAVGYIPNGIKQYLNKDIVPPQFLASYGLVFNGDFFQLWKRVDGLILPLTQIQKVTEDSLPKLIRQLEYCLNSPHRALVTAIWNQKGGVAKTTNTINLGAALALEGKKVLLIDLDTQTDLTRGLNIDSSAYSNYLSEYIDQLQVKNFYEAKKIVHTVIQKRQFSTSDRKKYNLDILPGERESLIEFRSRTDFDDSTKLQIFKRLISQVMEEYDYIFVDVSPTYDILTQCVHFSCDTILTPVDYSRKSLHHAVDLYQKTVPKTRAFRAKTNLLHTGPWNLGLVFSNCPLDIGIQLENCIQKELNRNNFTGKQYKTHLKAYAQTKLAEFQHVPVICWHNSPITKLYSDLAREVFLSHNFIDH